MANRFIYSEKTDDVKLKPINIVPNNDILVQMEINKGLKKCLEISKSDEDCEFIPLHLRVKSICCLCGNPSVTIDGWCEECLKYLTR